MSKLMRLALMLAAAALPGCRHQQAYNKPLTPVRVQVVTRAGGSPAMRYSAALEPKTRVDLAFKVGGYIRAIATVGGHPIQSGDRVTRGMELARIQSSDYDERIKQARSQLTEAEAGATAAKSAYDRAAALFKSSSLSRPEYEQAQAAYDSVRAKVQGARALVQQAENARADSVLESPIDGIVLKRLIEVGSLVGPGTGGFVLADVTSVKAVFGAPDTILASLKVGGTAPVSTEAVPNREFTGRITNIAPSADARSRVFDVELTIANPGGELKPGMTAVVQMSDPPHAERAPLVLPLTAVVRSGHKADGYAVFIVEEAGGKAVARLRDVTLGDMVGNGVVVLSGVREGEKVMVSGATIVTDGEVVSVIP
jgi:RND family efflux transporter MFP subunit